MTEQVTSQPTAIPSQEAAGFVVQTVRPDGSRLTTREQFEVLSQNPQFREQALTPGTPARAWIDRMDAEAAGVEPAPSVGVAPPEPPRPEEFTIPYPHGMEDSPERATADGIVRGWLVASGVDREKGNSLAALAAERIAHWEGVPDRSNAAAEAERVLRDVYRDQYEPRIDVAQRYVAHINREKPGYSAFLVHTGLANDVMFIHEMANLGEALAQKGVL